MSDNKRIEQPYDERLWRITGYDEDGYPQYIRRDFELPPGPRPCEGCYRPSCPEHCPNMPANNPT